jgi:AcrR family transcriptional regulator
MGVMSKRQMTPYPLAARELLRDTLLDAAHDEIERRSWAEITMADVARRAGVSRQTLYKEFGSREQFAQALVLREGDRLLRAVEQAVLQRLEDPVAALAAAFEVFLAEAAENPLVRTVVTDGGADDLLPLITTQGAPVVQYAAERLTGIVLSGWPQVPREQAELLAEALVRLAISYVALPGGRPGETAAAVMGLLGPYVERVLADAQQQRDTVDELA